MGAVGTDHAVPEVLSVSLPAVPDVAQGPVAPSVGLMLALQRAAGNVAVSRMLQREPAMLVPGQEEYDTGAQRAATRSSPPARRARRPTTRRPATRTTTTAASTSSTTPAPTRR